MELGPIWRALLRNKTGAILIALQIAVTMAIMVNAISIIQERSRLMARRLEFDFEWRITLFTLLLLPLLISLGFWQLQREDEKRALAAAFERQQALPPAPLASLAGQSPARPARDSQ